MLELFVDHPRLAALLAFACLALGLFGMVLLGLKVGRRRTRVAGAKPDPVPGVGAVEACVFGVFGLLIAFTFSGAAERFQARRQLVVKDAQALGTAWNRLGLLSSPAREELRLALREVLDLRLAAYREHSLEGFDRIAGRAAEQGDRLAAAAVEACRTPADAEFAEVVVPAINETNDIALARRAAVHTHPPLQIYLLLIAIALAVALHIGVTMGAAARPSWLHLVGFCLVFASALYVTIDLELPRAGLLRVDTADALLEDARSAMK